MALTRTSGRGTLVVSGGVAQAGGSDLQDVGEQAGSLVGRATPTPFLPVPSLFSKASSVPQPAGQAGPVSPESQWEGMS